MASSLRGVQALEDSRGGTLQVLGQRPDVGGGRYVDKRGDQIVASAQDSGYKSPVHLMVTRIIEPGVSGFRDIMVEVAPLLAHALLA